MLTRRSYLATFTWGFTTGIFIVLIIAYYSNNYDLLSIEIHNAEKKHNLNSHLNITSEKEAKRPRILCWIMTSPTNLHVKGKAVKETWGKRCDILLFMSSEADPNFPAVGLDVGEGRDKLWDKTRAAFEYVYKYHLHDADWFVKADDDTYMIIENLRYLLSNLDTSRPYFLGRYFVGQGGYNSGGAGYVFSRQTLRKFITALRSWFTKTCPKGYYENEDVAVGRCLKTMHIYPSNTRDLSDRETFMPFKPKLHLTPGYPVGAWIYEYNFRGYKDGLECCSDYPISFHYVSPAEIYHLEYMVYHLKVKRQV